MPTSVAPAAGGAPKGAPRKSAAAMEPAAKPCGSSPPAERTAMIRAQGRDRSTAVKPSGKRAATIIVRNRVHR